MASHSHNFTIAQFAFWFKTAHIAYFLFFRLWWHFFVTENNIYWWYLAFSSKVEILIIHALHQFHNWYELSKQLCIQIPSISAWYKIWSLTKCWKYHYYFRVQVILVFAKKATNVCKKIWIRSFKWGTMKPCRSKDCKVTSFQSSPRPGPQASLEHSNCSWKWPSDPNNFWLWTKKGQPPF